MDSKADTQPADELGRLAVARGYVTGPQLEAALAEQHAAALRGEHIDLGQLLLRRGLLTIVQLAGLLTEQGFKPDDETPLVHIGRYRIHGEHARGGMGVVYLAIDESLGRRVALKVMREADASPQRLERFRREASVAGRLAHPGIVPIHEVGVDGDAHFIAMEFVEGRTLGAWAREEKPSVDERVRMFHDIVRAAAHAHQNGVIHRDLKPDNVIVTHAGRPVVTDFGLARNVDEQDRLTQTAAVLGTPLYMAPEQVRGRGVDRRSDVYALGGVLYELLTGRTVFMGDTQAEVLQKILDAEPAPPRAGRDLDLIILKCLEKDPDRRYPDAQALADELDRLRSGEPILARPPSLTYLLRKRVAKHRAVAVALLAGVILAAVLLVLLPQLGRRGAALSEAQLKNLAQMRDLTDVQLELALAARRSGDMSKMRECLPKVESVCRQVIADLPAEAEPHYRLGRMYRALMRFDDAFAQQELALKKNPNYAPALYEHLLLLSRRHTSRMGELQREAKARAGDTLAATGRLDPGRFDPSTLSLKPMLDRAELRAVRDRMDADLKRMRGGIPEAKLLCAEGIREGCEFRDAEAEAKLKAALDADKYIEEAYEALSALFLRRGDRDEALEWARRGHESDRGFIPHLRAMENALDARATFEAAAGRDPGPWYQEGIAVNDKILALDPTDRESLGGRAGIHADWGMHLELNGGDSDPHYAAAVADIDAAVKLHPGDLWLREQRAGILGNAGVIARGRGRNPVDFYRRTIEDCDAVLANNPKNPRAALLRGGTLSNWADFLRATGDPAADEFLRRAIKGCDAALALDPTYLPAVMARAAAYVNAAFFDRGAGRDAAENFRLAVADYDAAVKLAPAAYDPLVRRALARVFSMGGEEAFRLAIADFDAALALRPNAPDALFGRCDALSAWASHLADHRRDAADMFRRALDAFNAAIAAHPKNAPGLAARGVLKMNWATVSNDEALAEEAFDDFDAALAINPASWVANIMKANFAYAIGRNREASVDEALLHYRRAVDGYTGAIAFNSRVPAALFSRGRVRLRWAVLVQARPGESRPLVDEGLKDLDAALALEPNHGEALWYRGLAHAMREQWQAAHDDFLRARAALPDLEPEFRAIWNEVEKKIEDF